MTYIIYRRIVKPGFSQGIDWQLDEDLPTLSVDLTQIQQVFINLISNAIEAMQGSQISSHMIVRASATEQNQMLIQVIDNGPGFEDQERIFNAFVTTKKMEWGVRPRRVAFYRRSPRRSALDRE